MMKKITLLVAALVVALGMNAQLELNNPMGSDGKMTCIYDCAKGEFRTDLPSNAVEVDELFTFAIDIAGTTLEQTIATNGGSIGFKFKNLDDMEEGDAITDNNFDGRFSLIEGTIYGADIAFYQYAMGRSEVSGPRYFPDLTEGKVHSLGVVLFGWGGVVPWWVEPQDHLTVPVITFAPYTGTKTFEGDFVAGDYAPEEGWNPTEGFIAPAGTATKEYLAIESIDADSQIVGYEYYSILGQKLDRQPESGIFIEKAINADGSVAAKKVLKVLK